MFLFFVDSQVSLKTEWPWWQVESLNCYRSKSRQLDLRWWLIYVDKTYFTAIQFQAEFRNSYFLPFLQNRVRSKCMQRTINDKFWPTETNFVYHVRRQLTITLCREILNVHFLKWAREKNAYYRYVNNVTVFDRPSNLALANMHSWQEWTLRFACWQRHDKCNLINK